jgi:hypothetical protein
MYDEAQEGGNNLPTKDKYDQYIEIFQPFHRTKKWDKFLKNTNTRFSLGTNLKDNNLFQKVLDKKKKKKKKKDSTEPHGVTLKTLFGMKKSLTL